MGFLFRQVTARIPLPSALRATCPLGEGIGDAAVLLEKHGEKRNFPLAFLGEACYNAQCVRIQGRDWDVAKR